MSRINDFISIADNIIKFNDKEYKCLINCGVNLYRKLGDNLDINEDVYDIFVLDNNELKIDDVINDNISNYILKRRIESYDGISRWVAYKINKDRINTQGNK